uniref:Retrotransposon gag domain-containing protein n=1 Tax=Fagus sylvatica TaxID=28930 RepID=A0A2N9EML0_FAGSY
MAKTPTVKCRKDVLTSIMDPLPRPPTPPKPEGRDSQLDSKIDGLEEKIQLMRGLSSFGTQIPSISHWKELADTFLAQYGLNSQIEPDCFDRQRMEKKSSEIFGEYTLVVERNGGLRHAPLLDEKEMIKIFVDTLKNPYFDRIVGLQLQFLVDLILVEERIEDAVR